MVFFVFIETIFSLISTNTIKGEDSVKKWFLLLVTLLLTSCNSMSLNPSTHSVIEWIDFVNIQGKHYQAIYSGVISDQGWIGKEIGEVSFKVADHVHDPNYQLKDGDAAFWEKGTKIYEIKNRPNLIAVNDKEMIHHYRLYYTEDSGNEEYSWHYQDLEKDRVAKVEFYQGNQKPKWLSTYTNRAQIEEILHILDTSKTQPDFKPNTDNGDSTHYRIVFYTGDPIAYQYELFYDGSQWYWYPWDTSLVDRDIEYYLEQQ